MSDQHHTYVIAEAGVNHNGRKGIALQLIDVAANAGADAVKFQTFRAGQLATGKAPQAAYQQASAGQSASQLDMLKRLELPFEWHQELVAHCADRNIEFISTAFDPDSLRFLVEEVGVGLIKIPSGEITNGPFLLDCARTALPVILSTGMSTLDEVEIALGVLAFGYLPTQERAAGNRAFRDAFRTADGQRVLREKVCLLHCTSEYPAAPETINLRAMDTLRARFSLTTGLSDHSQSIVVPIAAVARGAAIIEKHFTLDRNLAGPDHSASLEPEELKQMVDAIRAVEVALGTGEKQPTQGELANKAVVRKSLVAAREIRRGEEFSAANLGIKRPGTGISPLRYWDLIGRKSGRDYAADEIIND